MTEYHSGEWTINKGEYGIDHGTYWGLFHGSELVDWTKTLHAAKCVAARMGQKGEWTRGKVQRVVVEGKP